MSAQVSLWLPPEALPDPTRQTLIDTFSLPVTRQLPAAGLYLYFADGQLRLGQVGSKTSICVDFVSGSARHRRLQGGSELIAKAVNAKKYRTVWDFTAGLGRDAFVLASLGLNVTLFERHPVVAAMLQDALNRALQHPETEQAAHNMHLVFGDVATKSDFLQKQTRAQIIYLDPMYPESSKNAAVKKEMAFFHELVGYHADDRTLLPLALSLASKRVVVKRPRLGEKLNGQNPDYSYTGKSTRFDVYLPDHPEADQ